MIKIFKLSLFITVLIFYGCASHSEDVNKSGDVAVNSSELSSEDSFQSENKPSIPIDEEITIKEPHPFTDNPEVAEFIEKMSIKHGFEKDYLYNLFSQAEKTIKMKDTSADFTPPSPKKAQDKAPEKITEKKDKPLKKPAPKLIDWGYNKNKFINDKVINNGVIFYNQYKNTLLAAEKQYGVPPHIICGLLGIETRYGTIKMPYRTFDALASYSFYYPRRAKFFRSELESLLLFARSENRDPLSYWGSYAGAVGIPQFMPSNIKKFGVDGNGDGVIDIINTMEDAIFSAANFLNHFGWQKGMSVYVKVKINKKKYKEIAAVSPFKGTKMKVSQLKKAGVVFPSKLSPDREGVLFMVRNEGKTEYYVAFNNFFVIGKYNPSAVYCLAVNYLGVSIRMNEANKNK